MLLVLLLANIALRLVNPQVMRSFIDGALAGSALRLLSITALVFIAIVILQDELNKLAPAEGPT